MIGRTATQMYLPTESCPLNRVCKRCTYNASFGCHCRNHPCTFKSCVEEGCGSQVGKVCLDKSCSSFRIHRRNLSFQGFQIPSTFSHIELPEFILKSEEIRLVTPFSKRMFEAIRNPGEIRSILLPVYRKNTMKRLEKMGTAEDVLNGLDCPSDDIQLGVSCVGPDDTLDLITSKEYNRWVLTIKPDFAFSYDAYARPDFSKCSQWSRLTASITAAHDLAKEVIADDSPTGVIPYLTACDRHQFEVGVGLLRDIGFQHVSHHFEGFYDRNTYPKGSRRDRIQRWVRLFRNCHPGGKLVAYGMHRDDALATECDHFVRFSRDV